MQKEEVKQEEWRKILYFDPDREPYDSELPNSLKEQQAAGKGSAYAFYSDTDESLMFVKTTQELRTGDFYHGKRITFLYTNIEEYNGSEHVPWHYDGMFEFIEQVIVLDEIKPKSTAYWFDEFNKCKFFDLSKLNTSLVEDMSYMFSHVGESVGGSSIVIKGIENWDTSNVRNMEFMFGYSGCNSEKVHIGDLSKWNVSNVSNMQGMFWNCAANASEIHLKGLDKWNVEKVTENELFQNEHEGRIIPPKWKNQSKIIDAVVERQEMDESVDDNSCSIILQ